MHSTTWIQKEKEAESLKIRWKTQEYLKKN